jgi:hydroxymethylglutaryl-CoA lyase
VAQTITVYEVGPRDGLQNEAATVATAEKLALVRALGEAGLTRIEATSFVSPRWIPQLGDADVLVPGLPRLPGVSYVVLVPNAKGLERLVEALRRCGEGAPEVAAAVFMSASESHNRKNLNRTVDESLKELGAVVPAARAHGLGVRGYVSTVFGCPYEGAVDPGRAAAVAEALVAFGCDQISLGDTIGVSTPTLTRRVVARMTQTIPAAKLALHMHDTRGTALANVLVGLELGITTFDSSIGGLGGCPYAPGASGNLATEDLVYMLAGMGYETGVDFEKLIAAGALAQRLVGRRLPGKTLQAELARTEA